MMLREILEYLKKSGGSPTSIAKSDVAQWMASDDPEVMGAVYRLVSDASLVERIMPVLPFNEIFAFLLRYYEFCLRNDPQGNWVDDRFSAACDFVSAFVSFWDEGRDKKYFQEMKSLLRRLYTEGPGELKDSIEQAIVEHLFERSEIREFFSDWRDNPQLRPAYEAGKLWADGGGRSPLTEPRPR